MGMIKSILQTVFYFYLIYEFSFEEPQVFLLLFSIWSELALIVLTFIVLKFVSEGFRNWDYLGGIIVSVIPVLLILLLLVFAIPPNSSLPRTPKSTLMIKALIGVGINFVISIIYFVKNLGTESDFVVNLILKLVSVSIILLASFLLAANMNNPNNLTIALSIIAARILIEWLSNRGSIKKLRRVKL